MAGDTVNVSWIHTDGSARTNNYIIPNSNQCKGCHKAGENMLPIGPKARHLNRDFAYVRGQRKPTRALDAIRRSVRRTRPRASPAAACVGRPQDRQRSRPAPAPGWRSTAPIATAPRDPAQFRPRPARLAAEPDVLRHSQAAGCRRHRLRAGCPTTSFRANLTNRSWRSASRSTHPGIMMPELGKRLVHAEGVALVREWIASLPASAAEGPPEFP